MGYHARCRRHCTVQGKIFRFPGRRHGEPAGRSSLANKSVGRSRGTPTALRPANCCFFARGKKGQGRGGLHAATVTVPPCTSSASSSSTGARLAVAALLLVVLVLSPQEPWSMELAFLFTSQTLCLVCFITGFVSSFLHTTMRQQVYMTLRTDWLVRVRRKLISSVAVR